MYAQHQSPGPAQAYAPPAYAVPGHGSVTYAAQSYGAPVYGAHVTYGAPAVSVAPRVFAAPAMQPQFSAPTYAVHLASAAPARQYAYAASAAPAATYQQQPAAVQFALPRATVKSHGVTVINAADEKARCAATIQATGSDVAFVEQKLQQPGVLVLFSKTYCPFVIKAKEILNSLRPLPVMDVIELDQPPLSQPRHGPIQQALRAKTGDSTVPQAFVNGSFVGGCQEIDNLHRRGELVPTLQRLGCRFS